MSIKIVRILFLGFAFVSIAFTSPAQALAPGAIAPSLVQYTQAESTSSGRTRLFLYNSDGTYVEINYIVYSLTGSQSQPSRQGTYSYTVDPQNGNHATIVYDGGVTNALPNDEMYFMNPTAGMLNPIKPTGSGAASFVIYPHQSFSGGSNVSNRCTRAAATTAYTGFVIQGTSPRWVLIRAAGQSLSSFGVTPTVSAPSFSVFNSQQAASGTSAAWSVDPNLISGYNTVFSLVGAFGFQNGSDEAVLLEPLTPGVYTAVFKAPTAGQILCEVYLLPF